MQVHHIQCLTDLLLGKTLFRKALKQEKSSYLLWQLTCITLSGGSFPFLNASATSLTLSLKKNNSSDCWCRFLTAFGIKRFAQKETKCLRQSNFWNCVTEKSL